jgi:hypothetical protein
MPLFVEKEEDFETKWERREQNFKFKNWIDEVFEQHGRPDDGEIGKEELRIVMEQKERLEYEESRKVQQYFSSACPLPEKASSRKPLSIQNGNGYKEIDNEIFE